MIGTTRFECRCCDTTVGGWTDGHVVSPGWRHLVGGGVQGPDACCPKCCEELEATRGVTHWNGEPVALGSFYPVREGAWVAVHLDPVVDMTGEIASFLAQNLGDLIDEATAHELLPEGVAHPMRHEDVTATAIDVVDRLLADPTFCDSLRRSVRQIIARSV